MQLINNIIAIILLISIFGCNNRKSIFEISKVIECAHDAFLEYNEDEFKYMNLSGKNLFHSFIESNNYSLYNDDSMKYFPEPIQYCEMKLFLKNGFAGKTKLLSADQAKDSIRNSITDDNLMILVSDVGVKGDLFFLTLSYMFNSRVGLSTSFIINHRNSKCEIIKIIPGPII